MAYPSFSSGDVLLASDMNAVGLWRITDCTVTSTGGTSATASNGVITIGSGNTAVTVNAAFSANYSNYKIIVDEGTGSTTDNITIEIGSANAYTYGFSTVNFSTGAVTGTANNGTATTMLVGGMTTTWMNLYCEVHSPQLAQRTKIYSTWFNSGSAFTGVGFVNNNTQYTSFTIKPGTGGNSFSSGKIRVYGYRL